MKKRIIVIASLLIVAVAAFFIFSGSGKKKYEYRFDKVSQGDITMNVTATGTINAVTTVEVGTQVSGIISKLYADFNSVVKEGQLIAQIDPTFLQQSVKDASANLEKSRAQFADAKRSLERTKSLFEKNLESQATYDATLTQFESNQAALKQAEASLDRAKINLSYATIYAPISGVVIDRKVNVGQTVAASFSSPTLYTIANDLKKMQVQATIDESDIGRITIGQEVSFTVDAYPDDRFHGTVSQIRLAPVSISNVVNYTVIIDFDNEQLKLMPGMTANVRVVVGTATNVLRVPNMALRFQPPADLVDSTKIKGTQGGGEGRGPGMGMGGDRRARMTAMRDSINAAHGGQMNEEDLRAEMRKVFEKMRPAGEQPPAAPQSKPVARSSTKGRYGIQNNFPEYQKSAFVVSHMSGRGRVWILNSSGKLEPVFVVTGLTDGRYTEVTTPSLKPDDQLVLGATSNSETAATTTTSPLSGQSQRSPMGGGGPPR
jgi:HlyD family secretion protein